MEPAILFQLYVSGAASPAEQEQFFAWVRDPAQQEVLRSLMEEHIRSVQAGALQQIPGAAAEEILSAIYAVEATGPEKEQVVTMPAVHRVHFLQRYKWIAAAVLIGLIAVTGIWEINRHKEKRVDAVAEVKAPATNRAMITLGNGQTIYLDSAGNGRLALQNGVELVKLADGQIAYTAAIARAAGELQYNTLTNPRGSRAIQMRLPDGSQIWLNAGSSVTYPVVFAASERTITIDGEAYLDVAHDASRPFIVSKDDMHVTVLGTQFNVKAYDNEADIKVTLLKGSVRVHRGAQQQLLSPGQQAVVQSGSIAFVPDADTEEAVAWINGRTVINNADVAAVLREIERWYGIATEIKGELPERSFYVDVDRDGELSEMLKVLELNKVRYAYDAANKKLTVLP